MTIADNLQGLIASKEAIRQAIIAKGVDVPESSKLDSFPEYIMQIASGSGPTGDGTLADLKLALATDDPTKYYPIGSEIADKWDGSDNPLIVAHKLDSSNNALYGGVEGLIMVRKYATNYATNFNELPGMGFDSGPVGEYLRRDYLDKCSDELKPLLAEFTTKYQGFSISSSSKSKWFPMEAIELCATSYGVPGSSVGITWDYWKKQTGLSTPDKDGTANSGRKAYLPNGTAVSYWLRSSSTMSDTFISTTGATEGDDGSMAENYIYPFCVVAKS